MLTRKSNKMADRFGRSGKPGKGVSESKLRAFDIGNMSLGVTKTLSKREQEEMKKRRDQQATAAVYEEFVASFEDRGKLQKTWVKGGLAHGDKKMEDKGGGSRLYKPTSKLAELASTFSSTKDARKKEEERRQDDKPKFAFGKKKKEQEKKKSNLELFKEELKSIQEMREERHALKRSRGEMLPTVADDADLVPPSLRSSGNENEPKHRSGYGYVYGPSDMGDENTTNIYVGNINPKMTEKELCEVFGKYGPLASVKIMWPRTEEERARGRNCGFVAFMNRKDGERAMTALKGKEVSSFEMKLGWGKAVPIPPHPVYIPPALAELTQPPPPSGLPFNGQIKRKKASKDTIPGQLHMVPEDPVEFDKTLANAVVKVVIPTERQLLALIHRMVEFVVREGPMFEAMIMNRELNNPFFRFLFENKSPAHTYYRWKLYSILHGDSSTKWRTDEFHMFKGGSIWRPPPINPFTQGMPEDLVNREANCEFEVICRKGKLTNSQRDRLEDILRELTPERAKIADAMVWCLDHAEAAEEIVDCIAESLSILQTPIPKKISRLFLVSDILFNSSAKVPNASFFRKFLQVKLKEIFKDVNESYEKIEGRLKAEQFKQQVMNCFRAWEDWAIYPNDFLINLQNIFLGLVTSTAKDEGQEEAPAERPAPHLDGDPLEDMDGVPLDAASAAPGKDFDGEEMAEDLDGLPLDGSSKSKDNKQPKRTPPPAQQHQPAFIRSKWEEVDENELQAQAMTSSKWEMLEHDEEEDEDEDIDGKPVTMGGGGGGGQGGEDIDGLPFEDSYKRYSSHNRPAGSEEDGESLSAAGSRSGGVSPASRLGVSTISDTAHNLRLSTVSEDRRQRLREVEVKVVKYQDELEMGKRSRKSGMSIQEQVQHYRRKLQNKVLDSLDSPQPDRDGLSSSSSKKRHRSRSRSYSPSPPRRGRSPDSGQKKKKKDRSPKRSKRSRSRSRSRSRGRGSRSPGKERKKHRSSRKHRD